MNVRNEMLNLIRGRKEGHSLPQPFYIDPDFYKVDLELFWYREWLFAGHNCEIPKAGNFFTLQVGEYPVVVVRDRTGEIRAFHNSCRHRGSRVCTSAKGASAKLVCPYHQWTYDLDGKLLFARQMPEDFDPAAHSLKPIACQTVAGYIFICLSNEPADFQPFRTLMEPYFAPHNLTDAKIAHETTIIEKGNWKLVWENNRECYHCAGNHPELCKTYPEAPNVTGVSGGADDPEMAEHWAKCEAAGLPARFNIHETGQFRAIRSPLLRDAVSYTMSGRPAVRKNLSAQVNADRIGALMLFHYPTTWNHVLIDHAVTFRVLPLGPNETAVTTKWLVNKDAVEGVDYDLDELTHVWMHTNDQDRQIVEENARGIHSPAYEPGPYSALHEGGVMQFVEWYSSFLEPRLDGTRPLPIREVAA
ncbi:aromatic ring-hydroxylating oxygenase subunit alpha [Xanthobacter sp. TB0136]|uniref:aromatic ring-hydroxylating oxygenase subunit alpha n=1 Tax=Xanthobacter sp. TB0136 TaxID=3459177 RepID=UPI00403978D4